MDVYGFLWIMLVMKIPLGLLLWLVWWSVKQVPEPVDEDRGDDGGSKRPVEPRSGRPRRRPRGPHGDPASLPSPPRVRTVARGRSLQKR